MKKFFAGIAAAAIITVPMTSFALESMSKGALKKATGQAGVSIALDNVVIYMKSQPTVTYWDTDGTTKVNIGSGSTVGSVANAGIKIEYSAAAEKLITIGAILDGDDYGVTKMYETFGVGTATIDNTDPANPVITAIADGIGIVDDNTTEVLDPTTGKVAVGVGDRTPATNTFTNGISPLTIDVGTCQALTQGLAYNVSKTKLRTATDLAGGVDLTTLGHSADSNIAGVVIGLPTVEIKQYHTNDIKTISLVSNDAQHDAANADKAFIAIEKSGNSTTAILGGRLEIAPH